MKKNYLAIFCTIAIFLAAACTKETKAPVEKPVDPSEEPAQPGADEGELVPLTITVTGTKTYIDGSSVAWEEGESIAVYDGTAIREFTMTSLSPLKFSGSIDAGASYAWAVYPYADSGISATESSVVASLPAEQTLSGHNAAAGALLTAGKINLATGAVTLLNLHGTVSVSIAHDDIAEISVSGSNLAGTATFTEAGAVSGTVSNPASEIVLKPSGTAFENGSTVYVAALPGASVSAVSVKRTDGYKATKSLSTPKSIVRNSGFAAGELDKAALEWIYYVNDADDLMAWHSDHTQAWENAVESNYPDATNHKVLLTGDCNMSGKNWAYKHLRCEFDGAGHKIYNVVIERDSKEGENQPAFFNVLYADIHDVIFGSSDGVSYDGVSKIVNKTTTAQSFWAYTALLQSVGSGSNVTIENVINYIPVSTDASSVGKFRTAGILGTGGATNTKVLVKNCKNYGAITDNTTAVSTNAAGNMMGGIVCVCNNGNNAELTIEGCENHASVTSNQPAMFCLAGIIGRRYPNEEDITTTLVIKDCINTGNVSHINNSNTATMTFIGGIAGFLQPSNTYYKDGSDNYYTIVSGCVNGVSSGTQTRISTTGYKYAIGGIAGNISATKMTYCTNYADVVGVTTKELTAWANADSQRPSTPVGGIVGHTGSSYVYKTGAPAALAILNNCTNHGTVSGTHYMNDSGSNDGACGAATGGIAGSLRGFAECRNNVNTGSVTSANDYAGKWVYAGGIAAHMYQLSDKAAPKFSGNINLGTVDCKQNSGGSTNCVAGGIIGKLTASITACENYGNITGNASYSGSIMGMWRANIADHVFLSSNCVVGLQHSVNGTAASESNYQPNEAITAFQGSVLGSAKGTIYFGQINASNASSNVTISGTTNAATAPSL